MFCGLSKGEEMNKLSWRDAVSAILHLSQTFNLEETRLINRG